MKMSMSPMDAKKKAIEELMSHLDMHDGKDLGEAMKPKGVEVTQIEKLGDGSDEPDGDESLGMTDDGDSKPKMSEEEMAELIEALQSKLGA